MLLLMVKSQGLQPPTTPPLINFPKGLSPLLHRKLYVQSHGTDLIIRKLQVE